MIRISVMLIAVLSWQTKAQSQELTLDSAWQLARSHYPVLRDKLLIQKTAQLTLSNLQKGFLPQFTLSGQATYQSDVTRVPVSLPGFQIESPAKDQYKVLADVNQLLYDGGQIKQQKLVQAQSARVEEEKVEVELHQLHDRINQVYLGILYLDQQLRQVDLVKADIQSGINRVQAQARRRCGLQVKCGHAKGGMVKGRSAGYRYESVPRRMAAGFVAPDRP